MVIKVQSLIGNLHSREVYEKFKMAGASFLVLSILANGVPLYFLDLDIRKYPRGKNCNNKSALAQQEFVSDTLKEWQSKGFVKQIPLQEAKVVLPLSVAHRWSHSKGKLKYRLVLDCSPLTKKLSYGRIKLPDLNYLRNQIKKNDFIGLIDISKFVVTILPLLLFLSFKHRFICTSLYNPPLRTGCASNGILMMAGVLSASKL